jgi:maltose/moltooligosaccharide transporter
VKNVYNNQPVYALMLSGIFMLCAAVSVIYVYDPGAIRIKEELAMEPHLDSPSLS